MDRHNGPFYCCLLIHGAAHRAAQSEAAFLHWKERILSQPVCWTRDVDSKGFPVFHVTMIVYVKPQPGFLDETFQQSCAQMGISRDEVPYIDEKYFSAHDLFVDRICDGSH